MSSSRKGLLGLILASALAVSANGAEIYGNQQGWGSYKGGGYVPVTTWTGFYFGANGGWGGHESSDQLALPATFNGLQPAGGFGGLQAGYNFQFGNPLVFGIEADIQASALDDEKNDGIGDTFRSRLETFGTVRGRLGYAMDCTLLYFTGGLAFGSIKNEASIAGLPADFVINTTTAGYVLGGGVEYKFNPAWSVKAEYQYINLGKNDPHDPAFGSYVANGGIVRDDAFHTVRVGLNFHMHPCYEPIK